MLKSTIGISATGATSRLYGLESEKTFVDTETAEPISSNLAYFENLKKLKDKRGAIGTEIVYDGSTPLGVLSDWGTEGLDGSFHLGESSTVPLGDKDGGLGELSRRTLIELGECQEALEKIGGAVLNMSNNPLVLRDRRSVDRYSIPRPHSYARAVRGWDHSATIDASTQNSPSTSVSSFEAADAMSVMIGLGSVFVAIYANSPFYEGRVSSAQETRLHMWRQYFGSSNVPGDKDLFAAPPKPFEALRDYFNWIYSSPRSIYIATDTHRSGFPVIVDGEPSVMAYAQSEIATGKTYPGSEPVKLRPTLGHIGRNQFMQFYGARLRFKFTNDDASTTEFLAAMAGNSDQVEQFMDDETDYMYVEGRDPGANFVDKRFADMAPGPARSMYISPSALQAGLIANISESKKILDKFGWETLIGLREKAIQAGMNAEVNGVSMRQIVSLAIEAAGGGLSANDHWMIEYPLHVLRTEKNGATRALEKYEKLVGTTTKERIRKVLLDSKAIPATDLLR